MQAYLELIRLWTVNTNQLWIFQEVASASYRVKSSFTQKHKSQIKHKLQSPETLANNKALHSLAQQDRFVSREKSALFERIGACNTQGLKATHFNNWDYILCFDKPAFALLQKLQFLAQDSRGGKPQKSHVIQIEGTEVHKDLKITISEIKKATRQWLVEEFQWTKPDTNIKGGMWRTLQMIVPDTCTKALKTNKGAQRKKIQAKTGSQIYTSAAGDGKGALVSIVGPKNTLFDAKRMINDSS